MSHETDRQIVRQQRELWEDMDRLRRWGEQHPERFAGMWFDNTGVEDGTGSVRMGIAVVGDTATATQELHLLVDHPDRVVVVAKRFTYRQLLRLLDEIADAYLGRHRASAGTVEKNVQVHTLAAGP